MPSKITYEQEPNPRPMIVSEVQNNNLNMEFLSTVILRLPKPAEQQRIATCLSSLDDLIAAQSDRLAALQTHKQGLLQQLFPSPSEANA